MFARSVKYLYETNRFRLGKLDGTSSRRFLFAYRTKTEPCDWRSLHRWLSPPETPATTWTQMAPPLWCHPSCYLHPPRIQGWRGTILTSKGKIDWSFWSLFHIFSFPIEKCSFAWCLHSFFYSSMPVSKHRDFDNLINQWMDIILFLDWYETKIYDYYKFIFLFFLPSITFHNKNPISYHKIYSSSNINCRWKNEHSNQFKQSSSQIKIMSSF